MRSTVRLINYASAAMIIILVVTVLTQAVVWVDNTLHTPMGWVPVAVLVFVASLFGFDWSSKKLDQGKSD